FIFFFQAEDGIRDFHVTGVQTCALPIFRCLVCQNQTLADSNAELAADLRRQVETMILAGRSDSEIKSFLVERYGDFVLYRPPMQQNTWLLWIGPFALLFIGALVWWRIQRRGRASDVPDLERARRLLDE